MVSPGWTLNKALSIVLNGELKDLPVLLLSPDSLDTKKLSWEKLVINKKNKNSSEAYYWIEWILGFESICKKNKQIDGIYTPQTNEIWHSDARFRKLEREIYPSNK